MLCSGTETTSMLLRPSLVLGTALVACSLTSTVGASSVWPPDGLRVCTACRARGAFITSDAAGGAYIVWSDARNYASSGEDIYMQRVTADGEIAPGWPADGVSVCSAPEIQSIGRYSLVPDGLGGALVAWQDYRQLNVPGGTGSDIYALRVRPDGTIAPGWPAGGLPILVGAGNQDLPVVLADGTGGGFISWDDLDTGDIYLKRLLANGAIAPGWPTDGLPICTLPSLQGSPRLAPDGTGGLFIVWGDLRDGPVAIYAQRVTATGQLSPGWPENGSLVRAGSAIRDIVPDGVGGSFVSCATSGGLEDDDFYLQRFTAGGSLATGWSAGGVPVCLAPDYRSNLRMEVDGVGGVFLVWTDKRDVFDDDVFAVRMRSDGTLAPGWPLDGLRITDNSSALENYADLAPDGLEGAFLCWDQETSLTGSDLQVFVQHVRGDGSLAPGWPANGRALPTVTTASAPHMVGDGMGGALVAWEEYLDEKVRVLKIAPDGPVPTQISLVSVQAEPGLVRVAGYVADGVVRMATVERRADTGEWQQLSSIIPDGTGKLEYEDRDVKAGTRYGHRLGYQDGVDLLRTNDSWVTVPSFQFALRGLVPNPAVGDPVVSFTLAGSEPAILEFYDLSGRHVVRQDAGGRGPGIYSVRLAGAHLAAGMYALRLRQGTNVAWSRPVILR